MPSTKIWLIAALLPCVGAAQTKDGTFPRAPFTGTVAQMLAIASPVVGMIFGVTNGASSTDCATGGGSTKVACYYNGTAWAAVSSSSGGISSVFAGSQAQNVAYSATISASLAAVTNQSPIAFFTALTGATTITITNIPSQGGASFSYTTTEPSSGGTYNYSVTWANATNTCLTVPGASVSTTQFFQVNASGAVVGTGCTSSANILWLCSESSSPGTPGSGQIGWCDSTDHVPENTNASGVTALMIPRGTVAQMIALVPNKGLLFVVTDGTSTSDCATGGSTSIAVCAYNGASWAATGGGGSSPVAQNVLWCPFGTCDFNESTVQVSIPQNSVLYIEVLVPYPGIVVNNWTIVTGNLSATSGNLGIGFVSTSGTVLGQCTGAVGGTGTAVNCALGTPLSLPPGKAYFAVTSDTAGVTIFAPGREAGFSAYMANQNESSSTYRIFTGSVASSGGVIPSGGITTRTAWSNFAQAIPSVVFH